MSPEYELQALRVLEKKVRAMFAFTGWDQGCDEDAQKTVWAVSEVLDDIERTRRLLSDNGPSAHE